MATVSPTLEGFRAAFRRPSVTFGEIMWRWSVGATATAVLIFGFFEYLNTLPVSSGEMFFLRTRHPYLVAEAIAHILRGSLARAVLSLFTAALLMTVLWIIASSVGRMATVEALIEHIRTKFANLLDERNHSEREVAGGGPAQVFPVLVRLNFLRVAVALAAILGLVGAAIVAGFASPKSNPQPSLAFLIFLPLAGFVCLLWGALNWFLSLAAVLAVRSQEGAAQAMASAVTICRDRSGAVLAVSSWTGVAHLAAFGIASTLVSIPLSLGAVLPGRVVAAGVLLMTLVYLAIVDWLYVARMAGYLCIAEIPQALLASPPPAPVVAAPLQTTIDRDEPIISDVPGLMAES